MCAQCLVASGCGSFSGGRGGFFLGWGKRARSGSVGYILMACTSNEWYPVRNINPMCLCVVCEMATCNVLVADIEVVTMLNNIYNVEWRRRRSMTTQTGRICPAWSTFEVRDVSISPDSLGTNAAIERIKSASSGACEGRALLPHVMIQNFKAYRTAQDELAGKKGGTAQNRGRARARGHSYAALGRWRG